MSQRTALGIDVGGTKIAAAIVDLDDGTVSNRRRIPTDRDDGGQAVVARIRNLVQDILAKAEVAPTGVGIGLPELVTNAGVPASSWNFDIALQSLQDVGDGLPVVLDSDVRCGARAEMLYGAGRPFRNFSYVSIGTGLSTTQIINKQIHTGENGFAIHFGSNALVIPNSQGPIIDFKLEDYASGHAISKALGLAQFDVDEALAGKLGTDAQTRVKYSIRSTASYLGQIVNMLDPAAIIIGGGMGLAPAYLTELKVSLPEFIWAESCRNLPLCPAALGPNVGTVGAAAIFY